MKNTLVGFGILCASFGVSNAADALGAVDNIQRAALVRSTIMERDIEMGANAEQEGLINCFETSNRTRTFGNEIDFGCTWKVRKEVLYVAVALSGVTLIYMLAPKLVGF